MPWWSFAYAPLVLQASPWSLGEDVAAPSPLPVHACPYAICFQDSREAYGSKSGTIVGVEYFRHAPFQPFLKSNHAELALQGRRYFMAQNVSALPVHHDHQVHESGPHSDIRYVARPDLVGSLHIQAAEQVRIFFMFLVGPAQVGLLIDSLDDHFRH